MNKILWIDSDGIFIQPFIRRLEYNNYDVTHVSDILKAEQLIRQKKRWDILIIDIIMHVAEAAERKGYLPSETSGGYYTGSIFLERNWDYIKKQNMPILIFTILSEEDINITNDFVNYKVYVRDKLGCSTVDFLNLVNDLFKKRNIDNEQDR